MESPPGDQGKASDSPGSPKPSGAELNASPYSRDSSLAYSLVGLNDALHPLQMLSIGHMPLPWVGLARNCPTRLRLSCSMRAGVPQHQQLMGGVHSSRSCLFSHHLGRVPGSLSTPGSQCIACQLFEGEPHLPTSIGTGQGRGVCFPPTRPLEQMLWSPATNLVGQCNMGDSLLSQGGRSWWWLTIEQASCRRSGSLPSASEAEKDM